MIGQANLQSRILQLVEDDKFPHFSIFVGPKGSGRKTFAKQIVTAMQVYTTVYGFMLPDVKVETVRTVVKEAYKMPRAKNVYIIPDADNMSGAAKNALLKVTEEPPNDCYFIMTLENINAALDTIRSRATVFLMEAYAPAEIIDYLKASYPEHTSYMADLISGSCDTPGEVDLMMKFGAKEFYDYAELVVDNVAVVSLANAFKITNKIALKEGADGYDLKLFWKVLMKVCFDRKDFNMAFITGEYLRKLRITGINKQMLMDTWILEVREAKAWM